MRTLSVLIVLGWMLIGSVLGPVWGAGNEPVLPLPESGTADYRTTSRAFWQNELPSMLRRYAPRGFVGLGGLHATSASCVSAAFATEAITSTDATFSVGGNRVRAKSDGTGGTAAIDYATVGVDCTHAGPFTARVAICALTGNSSGNFQRAANSNYFINAVFPTVAVPADCTLLFDVTVASGVITAVTDRREMSPMQASQHVVNVLEYGADPSGVLDSTTAFTQAAQALWGAKLFIPAGLYTITDEIRVLGNSVCVEGAGKSLTVINFKPASSGKVLWRFETNPVAEQFYGCLSHMTLVGGTAAAPFTDQPKVAVKLVDSSEFRMDDLEILYWHDTTFASKGIQYQGRELFSGLRVSIMADIPISIEKDPNPAVTGVLDNDQMSWRDLYTRSAYNAGPVYSSSPGVVLQDGLALFHFSMHHAIHSGENGFISWVDTTAVAASQQMYLHDLRWEKPTAGVSGAYGVKIFRAGQGIYGVHIDGLTTGTPTSNGVTLSGCYMCVIRHHMHVAALGIPLSLADTNDQIRLEGNIYIGGTTAIGTLVDVFNLENDRAPTHMNAFLVNAANTSPYVKVNGLRLPPSNQIFNNYQANTWIPTLIGSGGGGGGNVYSSAIGRVVRVGRMVLATGTMVLTTKDAALAGNVLISGNPGIPFNGTAQTGLNQSGTVTIWSNVTQTAGYTQLGLNMASAGTSFQVIQSGSASASIVLPVAAIANNTAIGFSIVYEAD